MSDVLASLDMYCWRENRHEWQYLWKAIRGELVKLDIPAPLFLTFGRPIEEVWLDPNLLIGHTCGWPYVSKLRDKVSLIGRFNFGLEDCQPGHYNSVFIVSKNSKLSSMDELSDNNSSIAVSGTNSQSGFRSLREVFENIEPSERFIVTGSHRDSICAVANGEAELAAIDAITWELAKLYEPMVDDVKVIGRSLPKPGLPLITANTNRELVPQLFDAVRSAVDVVGEPLGIQNFLPAHDNDYEVLL
ncbi:MAG: PhnD/SsuA/transferrin family substrate-binding protein [Rhizobiaceae bacterium]